jgi:MFS family permease
MWSDRLGTRKPFVLAGFVATMVSGIGMALVHAPLQLFAFRALAGVAAATWTPLTVLFAAYYTRPSPHHAMAILQATSGLAQIVAALVGGWAAGHWGWTAPFYAGAALAAVGLACMSAVPDDTRNKPTRTVTLSIVLRLAHNPVARSAAVIAALGQFGFSVTVNTFTPIYAARLGASPEVLGVLAMVTLVPFTAAPIVGDTLLLAGVRGRYLVFGGYVVLTATTLVIPFIASIPLLMLSQGIGGLGRGLVFPFLMSCAIQAVAPSERATAMGFFQATYALGMTAGPWITGWLSGWLGLDGVFVVTAGLMGVAAVYSLRRLP